MYFNDFIWYLIFNLYLVVSNLSVTVKTCSVVVVVGAGVVVVVVVVGASVLGTVVVSKNVGLLLGNEGSFLRS